MQNEIYCNGHQGRHVTLSIYHAHNTIHIMIRCTIENRIAEKVIVLLLDLTKYRLLTCKYVCDK